MNVNTKAVRLVVILLIVFNGVLMSPFAPSALAQSASERQPTDMMVVIDNSCSMFPREKTIPGCEVWGNDPEFLRIKGADLFIARLGFAEPNASEYQMGIISMGEAPPTLVSPLRPLPDVRDLLARAINSPAPQLATQLVPALQMAYRELLESPARRPGNQPAVVLLTDGRPYPDAGQSSAVIESLVAEHPDIPLFVILLQNPAKTEEGFERYIKLWEGFQRTYSHVRTYRVNNARDIEKTYNEIVAQLQNTIPTSGFPLAPGEMLRVYVSKYVQRLIVTISHEPDRPKGSVEIKDASDKVVQDSDPDVEWFRGTDNPFEVISIGTERLDKAPRDDIWTVTSSSPVTVFLDRAGAYNFKFLAPAVILTTVTNQYLVSGRQSPSLPFVVRFQLLDKADNAIRETQPISGRIVHPDGSIAELPIPATLAPNADGVYEISHDFATTYPAALTTAGRFMLMFEAGSADDREGRRIPIARADLLVDVGRGAYIKEVSPQPFVCAAGQPTILTITAGDLDAARVESVVVRAAPASASGSEVVFAPGGGNTYVGDLNDLCQRMLTGLACDASVDDTLRVWLVSESKDGTVPPRSDHTVALKAQAPACTPTPTPTPIPPTPTPTPLPPDTDGDTIRDPSDSCPTQAQWSVLPRFDGCPPPIWLIILLGLLGLGVLAFLVSYLIPLLLVTTISPPPDGYVLICEGPKAQGAVKPLRSIGLSMRSSKITIGPKGHIKVGSAKPDRGAKPVPGAKPTPGAKPASDIKPVLFRVERRGKESVVVDAATGAQQFVIREIPNPLTYGNVTLKFSTDQKQLHC